MLSPYNRTSDRSVTFSWAATPDVPHADNAATATAIRARIAATILHGSLTVLMLVAVAACTFAQTAAGDPFAAHAWHGEIELQPAVEAWNYNGSHEELYGLTEGLTYGLRERLMLVLNQRVYYVSQRANDTWVLGLTLGIRVRVYRGARLSAFLEGGLGVSDAAIAAPPRGTRFNYLGLGSAGVLVHLHGRMQLLAGLQLTHLSNASIKGPGRNPDIEAIGTRTGLVIGF